MEFLQNRSISFCHFTSYSKSLELGVADLLFLSLSLAFFYLSLFFLSNSLFSSFFLFFSITPLPFFSISSPFVLVFLFFYVFLSYSLLFSSFVFLLFHHASLCVDIHPALSQFFFCIEILTWLLIAIIIKTATERRSQVRTLKCTFILCPFNAFELQKMVEFFFASWKTIIIRHFYLFDDIEKLMM